MEISIDGNEEMSAEEMSVVGNEEMSVVGKNAVDAHIQMSELSASWPPSTSHDHTHIA